MTEKQMTKLCSQAYLTTEDLINIALEDFTNYSNEVFTVMNITLKSILEANGEEYSGYDPEYPNNPYQEGYVLDDVKFITNYSGVIGRYWGNHLAIVENWRNN